MSIVLAHIFLLFLTFSKIVGADTPHFHESVDYAERSFLSQKGTICNSTMENRTRGFFIVHLAGRFKFDLKTVTSPDHHLILVTTEKGLSNLSELQKSYFLKILLIENLSVHALERLYFEALCELSKVSLDHSLPTLKVLCAEETSMACVAKLRDSLGLEGPGIQTISKFTDKIVMKNALREQGVPVPKYILFKPSDYSENPEKYLDDITQFLSLPIFAKKIDGTCSEGVAKLNDKNELRNWCDSHLNAVNYELDEFIDGTLFHCDSLIENSQIIAVQVCEYSHPNALFFIGKPLGSLTIPPESEEFQAIAKLNMDVLECLKPLPDGMTHLEVFRKKGGEFIFLEIGARPPGALIPSMYEVYLGFNIQEMHYKLQMNLPYHLPSSKGPYCAFFWFPFKQGTIVSLNAPSIQSKYTIKWVAQVGDVVKDSPTIRDRACEILIWNDDYTQLRKDYEWLSNCFEPFCSI